MVYNLSAEDPDLSSLVHEAIDIAGICVIENSMDSATICEAREAMIRAEAKFQQDVGKDRLDRALISGDNVLRLIMKFDPFFYSLFEHPIICDLTDALLSEFAILKFMNGSIIRHSVVEEYIQQRHFHMNTRQVHPGTMTSVDMIFLLDDWTAEKVALHVCQGTHQRGQISLKLLEQLAEPVNAKAGSLVVMDSTLWHYEHVNESAGETMILDMQFTQPYIKQHIDYVRALGEEALEMLPERSRRYLGWNARVPANLDEFYVPANDRLYKAGQP